MDGWRRVCPAFCDEDARRRHSGISRVDLDYDIEVQLDIAAKGFAVATVKTDDDAR